MNAGTQNRTRAECHNIHFYDDCHHRVFDPRTGEEILYETLKRYQFPTLSEVIDEIEVVMRELERQG